MYKGTVKQLSEATGIAQPQLSVLLKLISQCGGAEVVGYDTSDYKGRGKVPAIWQVKEEFTFTWPNKASDINEEKEAA